MMEKFLIGNAQDQEKGTGVTVILACDGAVGGVSVRGAAPGTRETELLRDGNTVEKINAVVLTGGSAFGLAACDGVTEYLRERDCGFDTGRFRVPIVCGAVLYDLEYKEFAYPDKAMGYQACKNAVRELPKCGAIGAGAGATVGKILREPSKGGLGVESISLSGGIFVTAIVAVNAFGDIFDENGEIIAGAKNENGYINTSKLLINGANITPRQGQNTTIGCIATNARLTKAQANRLAEVSHDGYALSIRPVHTEYDGDTVFVMASGEAKCDSFLRLQTAAVEVIARAVRKAVKHCNH